jgi:hypothetical protein
MFSHSLQIFLVLSVGIGSFLISGCGYKEGVLVKEPVSYLWFTGNVQQAIVKIDNGEPFDLSRAAAVQGEKEGKVYYQVPPGKHRVVVEKNGLRLVDRNLYIGDGNIQEIQIP